MKVFSYTYHFSDFASCVISHTNKFNITISKLFASTNMNTLYDSTCDFLRVALPEHITAFSVVYHVMDEEPWILKENLRQIFHQAITAVVPSCKPGSKASRITSKG